MAYAIPGHSGSLLQKRDELTITNNVLMWGHRVVTPASLQDKVKKELHACHFGSGHMKALARSYVWWPNIDGELESEVAACQMCQQHARAPPRTAVHPWPWPTRPWLRLHIDYAGPINVLMLLIAVDAHSKWIDVTPVRNATTEATIASLRLLFAAQGLPEVLISDNGALFTSAEFDVFCKRNGIRHLRIPPYHPASNGLTERAVETVKAGLRKQQDGDLHQKLARFLLNYRRTPQSTTGISPAELLLGRRLRTRLDLLRPSLTSTVEAKQEKWPGMNRRERDIPEDADVMTRNYGQGNTWLPGTVVEKRSPHSVVVKTPAGVLHRHPNQLRIMNALASKPAHNDEDDWLDIPAQHTDPPAPTSPPPPSLRRSQRQCHPPERLNL
jgi:hypothetical protein